MATFIVALIVFGLLFLAFRKVIHTKGCSCGCEKCGSHCGSCCEAENENKNKILTDKTGTVK